MLSAESSELPISTKVVVLTRRAPAVVLPHVVNDAFMRQAQCHTVGDELLQYLGGNPPGNADAGDGGVAITEVEDILACPIRVGRDFENKIADLTSGNHAPSVPRISRLRFPRIQAIIACVGLAEGTTRPMPESP